LELQAAQIFKTDPEGFTKPKINIFAVNSEEYEMPAWDEFKRVIRDAFTSADESQADESQAAIEILEVNITLPSTEPSKLLERARKGLRFLQNIINGKAEKGHFLRMHCEAVFAAFLEARTRSSSPTANTEVATLANKFNVRGLVSQ
jgi:hypothetical protein